MAEEHGPPFMFVAIALAAYAGLRLGEVCGLRWTDVDLTHARMLVARSWRKLPKSGKVKSVPVNPELLRILRQWRESCPETDENLVVPTQKGVVPGGAARWHKKWGMARAHHINDRMKPLLAKARVRVPSCHPFHTLRHSFATALAAAGTHPVELKELGRWDSMVMVERYSHAMPHRLASQVAKLNFAPSPPGEVASLAEERQRRAVAADHTDDHTEPVIAAPRKRD